MWLELPNVWIATINIIGIPLVHLAIAWWSTKLSCSWFRLEEPLSGKLPHPIYEHFFLIRSWKNHLPDAAPWFDGFPKGKLESTDPDYLRRFILETRRGEYSHWVQLFLICGFVVWNPFPANFIIIAYAIISNVPCILNLRYTRQRIRHLLHKQTSCHS